MKIIKSKYTSNLKNISDKEKFFIFFLKKYIEEHDLLKLCTIIDDNIYFTLLDMDYQLFDGPNNILLYPHLFVHNPEEFSISADYPELLAWYKAYLKDPNDAINDLADQLYEESVANLKKELVEEKEMLSALQKKLIPYDEQLKGKKPIKDNWFNFQFRPRRLELQTKRQKILDNIEHLQNLIKRKKEIINLPQNTRNHYVFTVKLNFEKKFNDIKPIIQFIEIIKELQYRLKDDNMLNPNRRRLLNDFYYYFEYYRLQYNVNLAKKELFALYSKAFMPQDIFEEYESLDEKDRDIIIDESFEEIKEMYETFQFGRFNKDFDLV